MARYIDTRSGYVGSHADRTRLAHNSHLSGKSTGGCISNAPSAIAVDAAPRGDVR
jgi:hypothetical protein